MSTDKPVPPLPGFLAHVPLGGDLEILDQIGQGGMATVFRARQPRLKRMVAVKFLSDLDAENRLRFLREANSLSELEHPHIVRLYDASTAGRVPYIVMELIEGTTLKELLGAGKIPPPRLVAIARQVAEALAFLHERGVVHRDLKPANILIAKDGTAKVADFGLARAIAPGQTLTTEGHLVGTPHFLAPEVLNCQKAVPASDVYAMGILMYQGLTGEMPFPADDMRQLLTAHLEMPAPDLLALAPEAGAELAGLVQRMMAKEPVLRPQDGAELGEELDRILSSAGWGRPVRPRRAAAAAQASRSASRSGPTAARSGVSASVPPPARSSWSELSPRIRLGMALLAFVGLGLLGALVRHAARRLPGSGDHAFPDSRGGSPAAWTAVLPTASAASAGAPPAAPAASWSPEALLLEPILARVPAGAKIPLLPVSSFSALPSEELATVQELSDQLRHSTFCSGMTIYIPTNPLTVEVGLVEPPGGVATFQLELLRTAHPAVRVLIARRDALPIALMPSANRRRFTSEHVPVRRGVNKVFLVFLQEEGKPAPIFVESLTMQLAAPGFVPPPPDPVGAPLTTPGLELSRQLERARNAANWEEVAAVGEQLTRLAPQYGPGWWRRGDAHRRLNRGEARCGMELLDEAVRRLPTSAWVWHDLGCAYNGQNWMPEAAHALAYAARLAPEEFWIWYDLATVTWKRGRGPDALAQLDRAARCPGAAEHAGTVALLRAEVLLASRDREAALAVLGKALAENPTDKDTRDFLARVQRGDLPPPVVPRRGVR